MGVPALFVRKEDLANEIAREPFDMKILFLGEVL
jgi:hypothetical protein